jgi:hypothetical protein
VHCSEIIQTLNRLASKVRDEVVRDFDHQRRAALADLRRGKHFLLAPALLCMTRASIRSCARRAVSFRALQNVRKPAQTERERDQRGSGHYENFADEHRIFRHCARPSVKMPAAEGR